MKPRMTGLGAVARDRLEKPAARWRASWGKWRIAAITTSGGAAPVNRANIDDIFARLVVPCEDGGGQMVGVAWRWHRYRHRACQGE